MKKFIPPLVAAAVLLTAQTLHSKHRNAPPDPTADTRTLRDAPGPVRLGGSDDAFSDQLQSIQEGARAGNRATAPSASPAESRVETTLPSGSDSGASRLEPLSLDKTIELSRFQGSTFLEAMMNPGGIKENIDSDEKTPFTIADKEQVLQKARDFFAPKVHGKISNLFRDGEQGFGALVDSLSGAKITPATAAGAIAKKLDALRLLKDPSKIGLAAVTIAPLLSITNGAGTLVRLNDGNFYYNIGYKPGSSDSTELAADVKSGRTFGVSPGHKALDVSDLDYLGELDGYLQKTSDPSAFYQTLFGVLTRCDSSNYEALTPDGQAVATDFLAIYTAELDRHIMTGLKQHSWQNDLAEVTLLSAYGVQAGLVEKGGRLVPGTPKDYFGIGQTGSGIGETRRDRKALQRAVTNAERKLHPDVVSAVESLVGASGGDAIDEVMTYLDDPQNQGAIKRNAPALMKAVAAFAAQIRTDADTITKNIRQ